MSGSLQTPASLQAEAPVSEPGGIQDISDSAFLRFRDLIQSEAGIYLRDSKRILVSNRLRKRLRALGLSSYDDYYDLLTGTDRGREEMFNFIDAISTNETYFYRGATQLEALRLAILPPMMKSRQELRIWSAACSTGEEPYSILIAVEEAARKMEWRGAVAMMATDISTRALALAREAVYDDRALRDLPPEYRSAYLEKRDDGRYEVCAAIKSRVTFSRHNLLKDPPPDRSMDIIFCRNVLMYFTRETQEQVVNRCFAPVLSPDGYLFLGSSESFVGMKLRFRYAGISHSQIYTPEDNEAHRDTRTGG